MIKYLGSKRTLVSTLTGVVHRLPDVRRVCDLFTGTTRVAQGFKTAGYHVRTNDVATYAHVFALAYIEADARALDLAKLGRILGELDALPGVRGYYTETFAEQARYFHPKNGARIDAVRDAIEGLDLTRHERAILLTALIEAADRVDSTTGLQMAYLKQWAPRAHNDLALRLPDLLPGTGEAFCEDAAAFVRRGGTETVDLTYLDPPYNQHSYFGNYHVWESLVRHDRPETYGIARKRLDTNDHRSVFNSKPKSRDAFAAVVTGIQSRYLLVSFNNEGYLSETDLLTILGGKGYVAQRSVDSKRYVGAQIGIYNPAGDKVGKVSHLRNKEHLFLVGPNRQEIEHALGVESLNRAQSSLAFG